MIRQFEECFTVEERIDFLFFDSECKDALQRVEKSLKKVLTKQNVCDRMKKLSYEKRKRKVRAQDLEN